MLIWGNYKKTVTTIQSPSRGHTERQQHNKTNEENKYAILVLYY